MIWPRRNFLRPQCSADLSRTYRTKWRPIKNLTLNPQAPSGGIITGTRAGREQRRTSLETAVLCSVCSGHLSCCRQCWLRTNSKIVSRHSEIQIKLSSPPLEMMSELPPYLVSYCSLHPAVTTLSPGRPVTPRHPALTRLSRAAALTFPRAAAASG